MAEDQSKPNATETQPDGTDDLQAASAHEGDRPSVDGEAGGTGPAQGPNPSTDEVAQLKDQLLRSYADVENIRRRAARDVEQAHKFAVEKLVNDLFPVLDSLEKAVETASATEGAGPIAEGVALSLKLFLDTLAKSGVEQIDPLGEPFDPQHHEAIAMVPNADMEPNSVMDVMARGYVLNGRLVRAAKVIVAKAPD